MEIKICKTCNGSGEVSEDIGTHKTEWETRTCSKCNGTGRIKTRSYSYSVPYDMENAEIFKVDAEIINLIRKLESRKF
jgi:DnaJ-class molecular chaperone